MTELWAVESSWLHGSPAALALARVCLVLMFPFSAIDKMLHWRDAVSQASSSFMPRAFAPAMLVCAMAIELVLPVCIVSGVAAQPAALVLALYCAVTAFMFHAFWRYEDFWVQGASEGRTHFWDFTKNFGLVGGLLLVSLGHGF
jgi:putative oxidoreductase